LCLTNAYPQKNLIDITHANTTVNINDTLNFGNGQPNYLYNNSFNNTKSENLTFSNIENTVKNHTAREEPETPIGTESMSMGIANESRFIPFNTTVMPLGKPLPFTFSLIFNNTNTTSENTIPHSSNITTPQFNISSVMPESSFLKNEFDGINSMSNFDLTPPDTSLAVNKDYVVETTNLAISIWKKNGQFVDLKSLRLFFNTTTNSDGLTDPRIIYDDDAKRWFVILQDKINNLILVAVSTNDNPTDSYDFYQFPFNGCPDQPSVGLSKDKFIVSVNIFGPNGCGPNYLGVQYTIVNKNDLIDRIRPPNTFQSTPDATIVSLHPATVSSINTTSDIVLIGRNETTTDKIRMVTIEGEISNNHDIRITNNEIKIHTTTKPPSALQPNMAAFPISAGEGRVLDTAYQNDKVWTTFNDGCVPKDINNLPDVQLRSCIRIIQLDATNKTVLADFDIGLTNSYIMFPALGLDLADNVALVYQMSSVEHYPSLLVSVHNASSTSDGFTPPLIISNGSALNIDFDRSSNRARTGDYNAAVHDPFNNNAFWVAGPYYHYAPPFFEQTWSTHIATFSIKDIEKAIRNNINR